MLKNIVAALVGATVGSGITYLYLNKKYHERSLREIEEVREYYASKAEKDHFEAVTEATPEITREDRMEYSDILKRSGYAEEAEPSKPYVITPDEFGDFPSDGWETQTLCIDEDGDVVNFAGAPLSDEEIETYIGKDSLSRVGQYEDHVVYVRNERLKIDYEVISDAPED